MVLHTCYPSYLGGVDWVSQSWQKNKQDPIPKNWADTHICHPSYMRGVSRRMV
jgi:hypothetical protein